MSTQKLEKTLLFEAVNKEPLVTRPKEGFRVLGAQSCWYLMSRVPGQDAQGLHPTPQTQPVWWSPEFLHENSIPPTNAEDAKASLWRCLRRKETRRPE